jgi:hypothetical protein
MATSFHLFPKLAPELRLRIWYHAIPIFPRILEVKSITYNEPSSSDLSLSDIFDSPNWKITPTSRPTLLHINSESRREMGTFLAFNREETICPKQPNIKLACSADTLLITLESICRRRGYVRGVFEEIFEDTSDVKKELRVLAGNETF